METKKKRLYYIEDEECTISRLGRSCDSYINAIEKANKGMRSELRKLRSLYIKEVSVNAKHFPLILSQSEAEILREVLRQTNKCIKTGEVDCEGELIYANSDNFLLSVNMQEVVQIEKIIKKLNK